MTGSNVQGSSPVIYSALLELCEIDSQVTTLSVENIDLEKRVRSQEARLRVLQQGAVELKQKAEDLATKCRMAIEHLDREEVRLTEKRNQLSQLGSKQGKFLERELDVSSQMLFKKREELLALEIESEDATKQAEGGATQLLEVEKEVESAIRIVRASHSRNTERIKLLQSERPEQVTHIPLPYLRAYERIQKKYPVGCVSEIQDSLCSACGRTLTPQLLNQILLATQPEFCPGCSRLLVFSRPPQPNENTSDTGDNEE